MKTEDFSSRPAAPQIHGFNANKILRYFLINALILFSLPLGIQQVFAASQLMVSPTRVVFEGRTRTARVTLANIGDKAGSYRISFVQRQMTESGNLAEIKNEIPGMYADTMVRFSPRQVTLNPGQSQTVRLLLRKKSGLEDGEYRSHLLFQALPDPEATSIQALSDKDEGKIQVQLIPVVGVTIPVIVRQGKLQAIATLSNLKFIPPTGNKQQARLSLTMHREGNRSVYGDFKVTFTPAKGTPVVVAQANGVAVYTPNNTRRFEMALQAPPGMSLKNGELHVVYLKHKQDARTGMIAENRLSLP